MKKSLLFALLAAMPLMAQECPDKPACCPKHPCCFGKMHRPQLTEEQKAAMKAKFMERFDTDKDGQISDAEKEAIKAQFEARHAERKARFMEKFDTDKDGQISDAEKEAIKAEFGKCGPRRHGKCGRKGPHHGKCCGPRPELSDEQKAAMKAKFEARRAEMLAKFDADKDGKLSCDERKAAREARHAERKARFMEKFDTDKDGQISDAEKEAIKAEFGKRGHRRHGKCCGPKCDKH